MLIYPHQRAAQSFPKRTLRPRSDKLPHHQPSSRPFVQIVFESFNRGFDDLDVLEIGVGSAEMEREFARERGMCAKSLGGSRRFGGIKGQRAIGRQNEDVLIRCVAHQPIAATRTDLSLDVVGDYQAYIVPIAGLHDDQSDVSVILRHHDPEMTSKRGIVDIAQLVAAEDEGPALPVDADTINLARR